MIRIKDINIWKILKILCLVLCTVVLLSACGDEENAKQSQGSSEPQTAASQRFECPSVGDGKSVMQNEQPDEDNRCASGRKQCIQASLLKVFYNGLSSMALNVYGKVTTEDLLSLMVLAFALWLAFQVLRHVSATSPESIGEFWTKVLRKAAICFACGYLASSPTNIIYVINTFVFPIYMTLLEFAAAILSMMSQKSCSLLDVVIDGETEPVNFTIADGGCSVPAGTSMQMSSSSFPQEPLDMMSCMACAVSDQLNAGYTVALRGVFGNGIFPFIVGIFLMAAFLIAKWGFVLYLVDAIFRMVMMIVIMPFLILFYAFEQTRKWSNVGFKIILNSAAIMLCLAILVSMTVFAVNELLTANGNQYGDLEQYQSFGTIPLSLIMMGFIIIKATGMAVTMSESVSGGGGDTKFQQKVAALIGTIAQVSFEALTSGAGKVATVAVKYSARLKALRDKVQKAREAMNKARQAMQRAAGRDKKQNQQGGEQ